MRTYLVPTGLLKFFHALCLSKPSISSLRQERSMRNIPLKAQLKDLKTSLLSFNFLIISIYIYNENRSLTKMQTFYDVILVTDKK